MAFGIIPVIVKFKHNAQKEFHSFQRYIHLVCTFLSKTYSCILFSRRMWGLDNGSGNYVRVAIARQKHDRSQYSCMGSGPSLETWQKVSDRYRMGHKRYARDGKNNCNVNGKCVFFFFTHFKRNTQNKNYGWKLKRSNFVVEK